MEINILRKLLNINQPFKLFVYLWDRYKIMKPKIYHFLIFVLLFFLFTCKHSLSQEFEMPSYITDMSSYDFDLDGANDIIVACPYSDSIVIMFNDGIGNFTLNYYTRYSGNSILCGLVDNDTLPDLITLSADGISFIKNLGQRTLGDNLTIYSLSGTISLTAIKDMNQDYFNDILYTNTYPEFWGMLKNNGNLNFTNEIIQSGSSTTLPAVGFLNSDSLPDIVLSYSAFDRSSVYLNNGNFNFTEVVLEETFVGEAFVMNLDNQGTEDFVFVNYYTNTIPLYKYIGDNQFELQSNFYAPGAYTIASFLVDDFNQDGFDDFAISRCNWNYCMDSIYVYINNQNWSFNNPNSYYVGTLYFFILKSEDLNGDSFPDLYMSGYNGNNKIKILWNNGDGTFSYQNPVKINENIISPVQINIFPNPFIAQTTINIRLAEPEDLEISITDLLGAQYKNILLNNSAIQTSYSFSFNGFKEKRNTCPPGIYILTVRSKSYQITRKIIKLN
jgi:hypothetical protein